MCSRPPNASWSAVPFAPGGSARRALQTTCVADRLLDPLSCNAYATEETLRALSLGGLALLFLTPWVALAVVVLLAVVVVSYRQTCYAYPNGGGAYAVSRENLGRNAALVAASASLVDYVLTVALSVAAGVDAITSAFLSLRPHSVGLSLLFIGVLALMNLRGVKESGTVFAIPTYGFIAVIFGMIGWGFWRMLTGEIIGVFVSFTLSQAGMVRHWITRLRSAAPKARYRLRRARLINAGGALLTGLVLVVVLSTKFTHGAYLVVIAMPVLFALMKAIERHYRHVGEELAAGPGGMSMPSRIDASSSCLAWTCRRFRHSRTPRRPSRIR
jgi:hypothetical protein